MPTNVSIITSNELFFVGRRGLPAECLPVRRLQVPPMIDIMTIVKLDAVRTSSKWIMGEQMSNMARMHANNSGMNQPLEVLLVHCYEHVIEGGCASAPMQQSMPSYSD